MAAITQQQAGILFTHPMVNGTTAGGTTFGGTSYFVQVYTEDDTWAGIAPVGNYSAVGSGLDGSDPYDTNTVDANGDDSVLDGPSETTDSKANQVNYSPVTIDDSPQMWVMYTPSVAGSIDVPLASCPWHWGGTLTWNAKTKGWSLAGATPAAAGNAPAGNTDKYPVWTGFFTQGNPPN